MIAVAAERSNLPRWIVSAIVVLGLHAAGAALLMTWRDPIGIGEPSFTVVVDLAPFAPPSESTQDVTPGPQQQQADEPPPKTEPKVEEKVDAPPEPPVAALPPPEPVRPKPRTPPPVRSAPATTAPPRAHASRAEVSSWYGKIVTQIARHKSYPQAAQSRGETGTAQVAFAISREGRVISSAIVRSSGHAALDQEAIATVRRAQPFPPAPAELNGNKFDFTVPVGFSLQ